MIKITLTETYGGFEIAGNYNDLEKLGESFHYFFEGNEDLKEKAMRERFLEFLKALQNTYQNKPQNDRIYSFKYCLPELVSDIIIFKYFAAKKEHCNQFDENIQEISLFFSEVVASIKDIVSRRKYAQIQNLILKGHMEPETYVKQWHDQLIIKYLSMSKSARQNRLAKVIEGICDWENFDNNGYEFTKEYVKNYCLEHHCKEEDVVLEEYPKKIDW